MIKVLLFLFLFALALLGCEKERAQVSSTNDQDLKTKRALKIKRLDSINLATLDRALMDPMKVESYIMVQFFHDTIPEKLFKLTELEYLSIGFTYIKKLPIGICNLNKLQVLSIDFNKITNIDNVTCLTNLRRIEARGNKLTRLPSDFNRLENLEYLHLSKNDFSEGLNSSLPKKIKEVELFNCNLALFPAELLELPFVEKIDLQNNPGLKEIPSEIRKLSHLRELVLTRTGIGEDQISELKRVLVNCTIYN